MTSIPRNATAPVILITTYHVVDVGLRYLYTMHRPHASHLPPET